MLISQRSECSFVDHLFWQRKSFSAVFDIRDRAELRFIFTRRISNIHLYITVDSWGHNHSRTTIITILSFVSLFLGRIAATT